jgi:hypothetical protein
MSRSRPPGGRAHTLLDAIVVAWTVAWLAAGVLVAGEVRRLAELSDTADRLGEAVVTVGETVGSLPLIGAQVSEPADRVRRAGADAVASARAARASARRVGVLLGVSIAAIPSLPVLLLYLPARIVAARERRALERAVAAGEHPGLDELLAWRAVSHLPYRALSRISDDPLGDLRDGDHTALADAELAWFGVERPNARRSAR